MRHALELSRDRLLWPALAGLCCLAGFGLRVNRLADQSFWLDEGATYAFATLPPGELIATTFSREPNPPLYYLIVHGWMSLAGDGEFSLRFLSVLASVVGLSLIYRLGRDLLSPMAALGAAFLAAFSPYLIWYAQEARMYGWLATLGTATLLALWRAYRRPTWHAWLASGLLLLATLYTHFFGIFIAAIAGVFIVVTGSVCGVRVGRGAPMKGAPLYALPALGGASALYLPWLAATLQAGAAEAGWRGSSGLGEIVGRSVVAFVHGGFLPDPGGAWLVGVEVFLAAGGVLAAARLGQGRWPAAALLVVGLALPSLGVFALSQRQPIFAERYVIAQAPVFLLVVAAGLVWLLRRWPLASLPCFVALALFAALAVREGWQNPEYRKEDFRAAAAYVGRHASAADVILLVAEYVRMPFAYYYQGPADLVPFVGTVDRLDEVLPPLVEGRQRVWLVLSHAEQVDPRGQVHRWLAERYPIGTEQFPKGIRLYGFRAAYRRPDLPSEAVPLRLRFGDAVELVGYLAESGIPSSDSRLHPPSNWLHVSLYWRALVSGGEARRSSVRVVDGRGVWGDRLGRPTETLAFFPMPRWSPGEIVVEDVDVNLNPATPAGEYQLEVRLLSADGQPLPVGGGSPMIGTVRITGPEKR